MIARRVGSFVGKAVNEAADQWALATDGSERIRRAFQRVGWSGVGWLPFLIFLYVLPSRHIVDVLVWLVLVVGCGLVFFLFLRRFGGASGPRDGGILWLLSVGIVVGIAGIAWASLETVLLLGGETAGGLGTTFVYWVCGGAAYGFCAKRIDLVEARTE